MPEMKSLTLNDKTYDCFVDSVARSQAAWSAVVDSASGENIVTSAASNFNFMGLHIFGKTTQNGTPTPDAPVDMVNIGDSGSITVNVTGETEAQSMSIATPNGLPGIKVTTGGNYTDVNGQQWICDEIDFARGMYVQRVNRRVLNGTEPWVKNASDLENYLYFLRVENLDGDEIMCDALPQKGADLMNKTGTSYDLMGVAINKTHRVIYLNMCMLMVENSEACLRNILSQRNIEVLYRLATPIETPLSNEELAAYADLHTYKDYTKVSNDAGAWMDLEYVMDARKYIDSQISAGILNATVEE